MATIRKWRGKYQVQIRRKGFAPRARSFHSKADAQEWARFMETQADRGELPTPVKLLEKYTLRQIVERYRDEVSVKKRSYWNEKHVLNAFLRLPMVDKPLSELTTADFITHREKRLKHVKPGTVNRELSIVKHALDIAMRDWDIPLRQNPIAKVKKLRVQNARSRRLAPEELALIEEKIETSRNAQLLPLIHFAIETAMRRGEILRLCWQDIDIKARTLHIPITKNGHPRTIPLSSAAIAILETLKTQVQSEEDLVFPTSDNAAKLAWQRLIDRTGIEDLHFHDLRHEAISRFFEKGLTVPEVALISGHRDFSMLARYTHMRAETIAVKLI